MNLEARLSLELDRGLLAGYSRLRNGGYDELMDAERRGPPALGSLPRRTRRPAPRRARSTRRTPQQPRARDGHRPRHLRRSDLAGKTLGGRPRPAHPLQQRVACAGSGAHPARPPVQCRSRRRLRRAEAAARGPDPAGAVVLRPRLPQPCHGIAPSSGHLRFYAVDLARERRRQLARHRQSHRDAGRRRLRTRQPRRAYAHRRRSVQSQQRPCAWRRSSSACRPT